MPENARAPETLYEEMGVVRVVSTDPEGRATMEFEARKSQCHSGGVVQGGFVTTWIDAAMAHACMARSGPGFVPMTLEIKVSYFGSARPGRVIAEAWAEKHGRRTCFYEGHLKAPDGTVLAKASSTILLMDLSKVQAASQAAQDGSTT